MRPIDADELQDKIEEWLDTVGNVTIGKGLSYYGELQGCIEECPTIDAEPVRHGKWILTKERNIWDEFTEVLKCSECGKFASHGRGIVVRHKYCPNCGAKLDGESEVLE